MLLKVSSLNILTVVKLEQTMVFTKQYQRFASLQSDKEISIMEENDKSFYQTLIDRLGYGQQIRSIEVIRAFVKHANHKGMWLFDSSIKRWHTPEEFMELYQRHDNIDTKWLDKLKVLDPTEGLDAADDQIKSIMERREVLEKRIIEYWKNKNS